MRLRVTKYILKGLSLLLVVATYACKKEKIDFSYNNAPVEHGPSTTRVVNLGDYYSQVVANGDSLTNFKEPGKGTA